MYDIHSALPLVWRQWYSQSIFDWDAKNKDPVGIKWQTLVKHHTHSSNDYINFKSARPADLQQIGTIQVKGDLPALLVPSNFLNI